MIDSHCHLTDRRFAGQIDAVLARAKAAGVERMLTVATTIDDARAAIDLCHHHDNIRCAIGIHPHEASHETIAQVHLLRELQNDPSVLALGEMGLDYHYDFAPRDMQRTLFEAELALAAELERPVVIHCREAVDDALAMMREQPAVRAVFHCFTGTADEARGILDAGHLLSFTGVITFGNSEPLRQVVRQVPLDRLMVETDAPYLAPEPYRKQRVNEPALVVYTAAEVARLLRVDPAVVGRVTAENAVRFFKWPD